MTLGKAKLGDKTMLDALAPFVDELDTRLASGEQLAAAWCDAGTVAQQAADDTSALTPKIGRARPLAAAQRRHARRGRALAGPVPAGRRQRPGPHL